MLRVMIFLFRWRKEQPSYHSQLTSKRDDIVCTSPPIESQFKVLQVIIGAPEEADVWIFDARIVSYQAGPLCRTIWMCWRRRWQEWSGTVDSTANRNGVRTRPGLLSVIKCTKKTKSMTSTSSSHQFRSKNKPWRERCAILQCTDMFDGMGWDEWL